jgi:hypothetical protein
MPFSGYAGEGADPNKEVFRGITCEGGPIMGIFSKSARAHFEKVMTVCVVVVGHAFFDHSGPTREK